ncbi:MAG TPA: hypothetical protein VFI73_06875 [Candidatus Nitrosopolaris sp.]|nr:hypothetical protein [Candidatus Nitrosopolaris sp.]
MTNSSSAYLGIAGGIAIGAVISWWTYNRQNKIGGAHDDILQRIEKLEDKNTNILAHLDAFARRHDNILNKILHLNETILALDKKIESINEKLD